MVDMLVSLLSVILEPTNNPQTLPIQATSRTSTRQTDIISWALELFWCSHMPNKFFPNCSSSMRLTAATSNIFNWCKHHISDICSSPQYLVESLKYFFQKNIIKNKRDTWPSSVRICVCLLTFEAPSFENVPKLAQTCLIDIWISFRRFSTRFVVQNRGGEHCSGLGLQSPRCLHCSTI